MVDLLKMTVLLFVRCWHFKKGPLITCRPGQPHSAVASITGTYCVCLTCGKQFAYDWQEMKLFDPEPSQMKLIAAKAAEIYAGSKLSAQ